jgi:N-acetylmuramoyl-L-alanine amidase
VVKIGLDCGHSKITKGKQTPDGIKEWDLNNQVRKRIVKILKDYDVEIVHTDNNEGYKDESLSSRLAKYKSEKVDAFVSLHHNAFGDNWNNATGVEIYVDKKATSKDMKLAECIYNRLVKYTGLKGRGIKKESFCVINQNTIPAVLVEGGFMTNGEIDYKIITSDFGQTAYAKAVAEGLIEFLKLKKKKTSLSSQKSLDDWAKEVITGKHGNGHTKRETSLKKAGCPYVYAKVRAKVNELLK